jgi:hypothetical protein
MFCAAASDGFVLPLAEKSTASMLNVTQSAAVPGRTPAAGLENTNRP